MDKLSYALGLGIGRQLNDMGANSLDIDDFAQAIKDVIAGRLPKSGKVKPKPSYRISSPTKRRNNVRKLRRNSRLTRQTERNT